MIGIDSLISLAVFPLPSAIFSGIDSRPETIDPVQADGRRSGCWFSRKPGPRNLSKGDKHPIFRVQVPFLFDPDSDPDFDLDFPDTILPFFRTQLVRGGTNG